MLSPVAPLLGIRVTLKDQNQITDPIELHKANGQVLCNLTWALGHLLALSSLEKISSEKLESLEGDFTEEHDGAAYSLGCLFKALADETFSQFEQLAEAITTDA